MSYWARCRLVCEVEARRRAFRGGDLAKNLLGFARRGRYQKVRLSLNEPPADATEALLAAESVAHDALPVAAELRVVAGEQHQPGEHPGAELVEHLPLAPVAVDLPVRRHRPVVHDPGVGSWGLGLGEVWGYGFGLRDVTAAATCVELPL